MLLIFVYDWSFWPRNSNINRSLIVVSSNLDCLFSRYTITGYQNNSFRQSSEECQILESHYTGAIFSNTDSSMSTHHFQMTSADSCNSDLISCSHQKGCYSTTKWYIFSAGKTSRNSNHILLCKIALNKTFRVSFLKKHRESTILGICIERNHSITRLPCLNKCISISLPC